MTVTLGRQIKAMRALKGMRQGELAELANVRQPTLSEFENDRILPCKDTLQRIKAALSWPDESQADAAFAILSGDGKESNHVSSMQ